MPFAYQSVESGIGVTEDHSCVWYRRSFSVDPEKLKNRRLLLKFGAVDYEAQVFVNGVSVCIHTGGHTSFEVDITDYVLPGTNELKVCVRDGLETDKPRASRAGPAAPLAAGILPPPASRQEIKHGQENRMLCAACNAASTAATDRQKPIHAAEGHQRPSGGDAGTVYLAAYAFARIIFTGKNLIFGLMLVSMVIPGMRLSRPQR